MIILKIKLIFLIERYKRNNSKRITYRFLMEIFVHINVQNVH